MALPMCAAGDPRHHRSGGTRAGVLVQTRRTQQGAGPVVRRRWSLASATADEARLVPPVLRAIVEGLSGPDFGSVTGPRDSYIAVAGSVLYADEAEWIVKLRLASPDMELQTVYDVAREYVRRAQRGRETSGLDMYVVLELWRDPARHAKAVNKGVTDYLPLSRAVMEQLAVDPDTSPDLRELARGVTGKGKRS